MRAATGNTLPSDWGNVATTGLFACEAFFSGWLAGLAESAMWQVASFAKAGRRARVAWKKLMRAATGNTRPPDQFGSWNEGDQRLSVAFWNCCNLWAEQSRCKEKAEARESGKKLVALELILSRDAPDVLALLEVVCADVRGFRSLRRWLSKRGYEARVLPGEGKSDEGGVLKVVGRNAVVVAVKKEAASWESFERLATRTAGVGLRCNADRKLRFFSVIHGLHGVARRVTCDTGLEDSVETSTFADQAEAVRRYLESKGGGLALGDWNRVPCKLWRRSGKVQVGDGEIRRLSGFTCECCSPKGAACAGRVVGGSAFRFAHEGYTRFERVGGVLKEATSRLDYAVKCGAGCGSGDAWRLVEQAVVEDAAGLSLSDHLLVRVECALPAPLRGPSRPLPVRMRGSAVAEATFSIFQEIRQSDEDGLRACLTRALDEGMSATQAWVRKYRAMAEMARAIALEREAARSARGIGPRGGQSGAHEIFQTWRKRLDCALRFRSDDPADFDKFPVLFHPKTGLRRTYLAASVTSARAGWQAVVSRCRRETGRAGRARRRQLAKEDAALLEWAVEAVREQNEKGVIRLHRLWQALSPRKGGLGLSALHRGDDANAPQVTMAEEDFLGEAGRIGARTVGNLDRAPVMAAFEAWLATFVTKQETLEGTDGGVWALAKELTWPVFLSVIKSMKKGKAVGAGGFSCELLAGASSTVLRSLYDSLMADVRRGKLSEDWGKVLYVLLAKKAPNNPDIVAERRDIALMAQEMKILLQAVRWTCYSRIGRRLLHDQLGWVTGHGAYDPGLTAALAIQMARTLQTDVYLLYIDLAAFFPSIHRGALAAAELWEGVPDEVVDLALLIYGAHDDPDNAVQCQYDTAAGLGDAFRNPRGALMGCVLSPDRAKILLNSIISAIHLHVKGVRLWGWGEREQAETWRHICQVAFADDWFGLFTSAEEAEAAWEIWSAWEVISGCKLGIKGSVKTVLSGVRWVDGKAVAPKDLQLRSADGVLVPMIPPSEAYKHLGVWRRADGVDATAWKALRKDLMAAIARLKRIRPKSMSEGDFLLVSDALIGGIGGYTLRTLYITREQAEEVEAAWRKVYRLHCRKARSAPRALIYAGGSLGRGRTHLFSVGLSAVFDSLSLAIMEKGGSSHSMAACSAVARAAAVWGCREDPLLWEYDHWLPAMEAHLKAAEMKDLGLAWLLAKGLLNGAATSAEEVAGRMRPWGEVARGNPLAAGASHFARAQSTEVFAPVSRGGLGITPCGRLVRAGCVFLEDFCQVSDSGELVWLEDFDDVSDRHPRIDDESGWYKDWESVLSDLFMADVSPVRPGAERLHPLEAGARPAHSAMAVRASARYCRLRDGMRSVVRTARAEIRASAGCVEWAAPKLAFGEWKAKFEAIAEGVVPPSAYSWDSGGDYRYLSEIGARVVYDISDKLQESVGGRGEGGWMARADVGEDGFLEGWRLRLRSFRRSLMLNEGAFLCWADGRRVSEEEAASSLPPALQAYVSARRVLSGLGTRVDLGPAPVKGKRNRLRSSSESGMRPVGEAPRAPDAKAAERVISWEVAAAELDQLMVQQARFGLTAVATLDASQQKERDEQGRLVRDEKGEAVQLVGRATGLQDRTSLTAFMEEDTGNDNYLGELAAQLDALSYLPAGGRVMIIFDATSPVMAMRRFALACAKARQKYYAGSWLEHFIRLIRRQEVVVFRWQTSHVGSPLNEYADWLADMAVSEARQFGGGPVPRGPVEFGSFYWSAARRSVYEWARTQAQRAVQGWLAGFASETPLRDGSELRLPPLPGRVEGWADRVLAARAHVGDPRVRRELGGRCSDADFVCPFGCVEGGVRAAFTWAHVQLTCKECSVAAARVTWASTVERRGVVLDGGMGVHPQLRTCRVLLDRASTCRAGEVAVPLAVHESRALRRLLGAAVDPPESGSSSRAAKSAAWEIVVAGLEVQAAAEEASKGFSRKVMALVRGRNKLARHVQAWRQVVLAGGPRRALLLARLCNARDVVLAATSSLVLTPVGSASREELIGSVFAEMVTPAIAGTLTATPVQDLWLRVWLLRWRLLARALHKCRRRAAVARVRGALRFWNTEMRKSRPVLRFGWARAQPARRVDPHDMAAPPEAQDLMARLAGGRWGVAVCWPRGGVQGRRFCKGGVWKPIRVAAAARLGWRAWAEAGGTPAMDREAGKARRAGETRAAALLVADLQRRGQEVPRLLLDMGCSRRPLFTSAGVRIRVLLNGQTAAGAAADARGRWAVKEITGWRGGFANREALVVWQGFHPSTGLPWPAEWVSRNRLTKDLRSGGLIRPKRAATPLLPAAAGGKRSSRIAGEVPVAPMESEAAVRKKARADKAAAEELVKEREAEEEFAEEASGRRRSRRRVGLPAA